MKWLASFALAVVLIVLAALLAGCDDRRAPYADHQRPLQSIPELADCVYMRVDISGPTPYLHVIRCPSSDTTTHWTTGGKSKKHHSTTVVD